MVTIKEALKYPFGKFARLFNYYWLLVPIWGWFVVYGYMIRVINDIWAGNESELPAIRPFGGLFSTGFFVLVISLALSILAGIASVIPYIGWLVYIYLILVIPVMIMQYAESKRVGDGFNFVRASKMVFMNFGNYIVMWLKVLVVAIVFLIASIPIITLIITIPAMSFSQYFLLADFYKQAKDKAEN